MIDGNNGAAVGGMKDGIKDFLLEGATLGNMVATLMGELKAQ